MWRYKNSLTRPGLRRAKRKRKNRRDWPGIPRPGFRRRFAALQVAQLCPYTSAMRYPALALAFVASLPTALSFLETSPLVAWSSHR
jgi:hypothetical protein